jgi:hypothetical protein
MPDHSDAIIPFDLSLKIPLWSKLGSCIHSHFHFLNAVESANSNCECGSHQPVPPIMLHPNASFLYRDSQCNHHKKYSLLWTVHHFLLHCTPIKPHPYTSINRLWIKGETCVPFNWITLWPSAQSQVSSVIAIAHQLIPWIVSDSCTICCMLPVLQLLPPLTKSFRAFLTEHAAQ